MTPQRKMNIPASERRRRIRNRTLIALWFTGLIAPFLWLLRLYLLQPPAITSSPETTRFIVTLNDDGMLDLSELIRKHCNCPVDADANAGVALASLPEQPMLVADMAREIAHAEQWDTSESSWLTLAHRAARRRLTWAAGNPWTEDEFPLLRATMEAEQDYVNAWKAAVSRPRIGKPVGTTIHVLRQRIEKGIPPLLRRANLAIGERRWQDAISDYTAADDAVERLAELQCGWLIGPAISQRAIISWRLAAAIIRQPDVPTTFLDWAERRFQWPYHDRIADAANTALRIQYLTTLSEVRAGKLRLAVRALLPADPRLSELQLQRFTNAVNWTQAAALQNDVIDDYVEAMRIEDHAECRLQCDSIFARIKQVPGPTVVLKQRSPLQPGDITINVAYWAMGSGGYWMRHLLNRRTQLVEEDLRLALAICASRRPTNPRSPETEEQSLPLWELAVRRGLIPTIPSQAEDKIARTTLQIVAGSKFVPTPLPNR